MSSISAKKALTGCFPPQPLERLGVAISDEEAAATNATGVSEGPTGGTQENDSADDISGRNEEAGCSNANWANFQDETQNELALEGVEEEGVTPLQRALAIPPDTDETMNDNGMLFVLFCSTITTNSCAN